MERDDFPTGEAGPKPYQQVLGNVLYSSEDPTPYQESRGLGNTTIPANHEQ